MPSAISNFFIQAVVRSPLHPLLGPRFAVVSVRGLKTGKTYTTPINVTWEDGRYLAISFRHRTWWRNLRGGRPAELTVGGKTIRVTGDVVEATADVIRGLQDYFRRYPAHARYFDVMLEADGRPKESDLEISAGERVIIRLVPTVTGG